MAIELKNELIEIELRGKVYSGVITPRELMFFATKFFSTDEEQKDVQITGIKAMLNVVQDRNRKLAKDLEAKALLEIRSKDPKISKEKAEKLAKEQSLKEFEENLSMDIYLKLEGNHKIETATAVRLLKIFGTLDSLVKYDPSNELGFIYLNPHEMLNLVLTILAKATGTSYEPAQPVSASPLVETKPEPPVTVEVVLPEAPEVPFNMPPEIWSQLSQEQQQKLIDKAKVAP